MADVRQGVSRAADSPQELDVYKAQQLREYGTFVAVQDIYAGLALAYREGDPVPVSNVEAQNYEKMGLVRRIEPDPAPVSTPTKSTPAKKEEGK